MYTFFGIWLTCAVESQLLHKVYVWLNLQPHYYSHIPLSAYKICGVTNQMRLLKVSVHFEISLDSCKAHSEDTTSGFIFALRWIEQVWCRFKSPILNNVLLSKSRPKLAAVGNQQNYALSLATLRTFIENCLQAVYSIHHSASFCNKWQIYDSKQISELNRGGKLGS